MPDSKDSPASVLRSLLGFVLRAVIAYILAWPVALLIVLAFDGMLAGQRSAVIEFVREYVASLPYMVRPGLELATYAKLLSVVIAVVGMVVWTIVRLWRGRSVGT